MRDPEHKITQFLLYLHTQETFLYKDLKKASRDKDESKIITLGPYALVLSFILLKRKSSQKSKVNFVYRGMYISKKLFDR